MTPATYTIINYALYSVITMMITILVGRSLHKNGRVFLKECFRDAAMADSVNHLLLVGFYLVNFGILALLLKVETPPTTLNSLIECLATKVGVALLGLGITHLFNMWNFDNLRAKALRKIAEAEESGSPAQLPTGN